MRSGLYRAFYKKIFVQINLLLGLPVHWTNHLIKGVIKIWLGLTIEILVDVELLSLLQATQVIRAPMILAMLWKIGAARFIEVFLSVVHGIY